MCKHMFARVSVGDTCTQLQASALNGRAWYESHTAWCIKNIQAQINIVYPSLLHYLPSIVRSLTRSGFPTSIELLWTPPTELAGIITGYFLTYSTGSGDSELSSENIPASVTSYIQGAGWSCEGHHWILLWTRDRQCHSL